MYGKGQKNSFLRRRGGFTLIELVVVIAIIGILAAITVPVVSGTVGGARGSQREGDLKAVLNANERFASDAGSDAVTGSPTTIVEDLNDDGFIVVVIDTSSAPTNEITLLNSGTVTEGPVLIDENFASSLDTGLEDTGFGAYTIIDGAIRKTVFTDQNDRRYIRTKYTDYIGNDFVAELTFTLTDPTGTPVVIHYFGLGPGSPDAFFNESAGAFFRIHGPKTADGRVDLVTRSPGATVNFTEQTPIGFITTIGGTHRARITKTGTELVFEIDVDYDSVTFVSDIEATVNLATDIEQDFLDETNSRIFFGTASADDTFDDLLIIADDPVVSETFILDVTCGDGTTLTAAIADCFTSVDFSLLVPDTLSSGPSHSDDDISVQSVDDGSPDLEVRDVNRAGDTLLLFTDRDIDAAFDVLAAWSFSGDVLLLIDQSDY